MDSPHAKIPQSLTVWKRKPRKNPAAKKEYETFSKKNITVIQLVDKQYSAFRACGTISNIRLEAVPE